MTLTGKVRKEKKSIAEVQKYCCDGTMTELNSKLVNLFQKMPFESFVPLPKQTCWGIKLKNCLERAFVAHRYEQMNRNSFPFLTLRLTVPLESYIENNSWISRCRKMKILSPTQNISCSLK